jgi:hypothetical protein
MKVRFNSGMFFVVELSFDKSKGYRPCWSGWSEVHDTRAKARKVMRRFVNQANDSKRGRIDWVTHRCNSGRHDDTSFVVMSCKEMQECMDKRFLKTGRSYPWWTTL